MTEVERAARLAHQERRRALRRAHGHEARIFCAHDPVELVAARRGV
jgi:hypothetical protein